jgi:hypothetical protein
MTTIIHTAAELQAINDNLAGDYELGNDIDMSGVDWTPIGSTTSFTGSLDGKGYSISNLAKSTAFFEEFGLFYAMDWTLHDIRLLNVNITGAGNNNIGSLIIYATNATITECCSTGSITLAAHDGYFGEAGGLIFWITNSAVSRCYSTITIIGNDDDDRCGGFATRVDGTSTITDCYSQGNVSGRVAAGFIYDMSDTASITNCYSTGLVAENGGDPTNAAGLVLNFDVGNTSTACYWDTETSGQATSSAGTGKTTAQMQTQSTFTGWNFTTIWGMFDYPVLQWVTCVATSPATQITNSSAFLNGRENACTTVYFEYGRATDNLNNSTSPMSATDTFYRRVDGLSPSVVHYFRAVGKVNSGGATYGDTLSFTTEDVVDPPQRYAFLWVEGTKLRLNTDT